MVKHHPRLLLFFGFAILLGGLLWFLSVHSPLPPLHTFGVMPKPQLEPCTPPIDMDKIKFGASLNRDVSSRMSEIWKLDQDSRVNVMQSEKPSSIEAWAEIADQDRKNRVEVLTFLVTGKLFVDTDYMTAAFVFQHGNCPDHYKLANILAEKAMNMGNVLARWLYAATMDRYLLSVSKPQKYGTQYAVGLDGKWHLAPVDPATTDTERTKFNVPTLEEAEVKANTFPLPAPTSTSTSDAF